MLLVITNSQDATVDYFLERNSSSLLKYIRFDTDLCFEKTMVGTDSLKPYIEINKVKYYPEEFSTVWFRRPKSFNISVTKDIYEKEHINNEWGGMFENFFSQIPLSRWVNHPSSNIHASYKIDQLLNAREIGLKIPDTLVTQKQEELEAFYKKYDANIIIKPITSGYIEREHEENDTHIFTNKVTKESLLNIDLIKNCPCLFQENISNKVDVRLVYIDGEFIAVKLINDNVLDIRRDNMEGVIYKEIKPPQDISLKVKQLMDLYKLRFAVLDFVISSKGEWVFLEINPNGQWAWLDLSGVTNISDILLERFL